MRLLPPTPVCDDAEFVNAGLERIWLSRRVADAGPVGLFIGLNPSTAGATETDHTITKEKEFARRWGWSGFWKGNLFTCVETYSANLKNLRLETAVGEQGDAVLGTMVLVAPEIVVCWGNNVPKDKRARITDVLHMIATLKRVDVPVRCFGLSKEGAPMHPLMLSYETQLVDFELPGKRVSRR
jgi:hypothetical protein